MNHIDTAADLFREIKRRGLELRRGEGRDDVLYRHLADRFGLKADQVQKGLDEGKISVEEFVSAFFSILQPFAQMYSDIYAEMQRQGAKSATDSVRIQFDFSKAEKASLKFDLEHFREVERLLRRVKAYATIRLWTHDDLHKLFEFQNILNANLTHESYYENYIPGEPYQIPHIPSVNEPLRQTLITVRDIYQRIIDLAAEQKTEKTPRDILQDLQEEEWCGDLAEDRTTIKNLSGLLTDLLPGFLNLVGHLHEPMTEQKIGYRRIGEAVDYFEKEIIAHLHHREGERNVLIQDLLDFLNLPMWEHRWYLYEVWSSIQVITALREYDAQFVLSGDILRFEEGRATRIAEFDTATGTHIDLWAQKQTSLSGVPGRQAIMPDLRLCRPDGNLPEDTIVLVEFKQRKSMGRAETISLANIYDKGTPQSLGNFYLNYDAFPPGIENEIDDPSKSFLFGFLNPQYPDNIAAFQGQLVEVLNVGGYKPVGGWFDVLLLDVSGSMTREYSDPEVIRALDRIVSLHPHIHIYFFDTRLIDPGSRKAISTSETIDRYLGGGTQLERVLRSLSVKEPNARRLLVVTDGKYGNAPSLGGYEKVRECMPADLHQVISDLRR